LSVFVAPKLRQNCKKNQVGGRISKLKVTNMMDIARTLDEFSSNKITKWKFSKVENLDFGEKIWILKFAKKNGKWKIMYNGNVAFYAKISTS